MFESPEAKRLLILAGSTLLIFLSISGIRAREYIPGRTRTPYRIVGTWAVLINLLFLIMGILAFLAFVFFDSSPGVFCLAFFIPIPFGVLLQALAPKQPL